MTENKIPKFAKVFVLVAAILVAVVIVVALLVSDALQNRRQSDCERSVQFRADTRAMWVWLGEQFPEGAQEVGLQEKLDQLVPELTCEDGTLTPVRP